MTSTIPPPTESAAQLAKQLAALRDPGLEVRWIGARLRDLGAAQAADILSVVLARAEQREEPYSQLLLRASVALAAPEAEGLRRAIGSVAAVRKQGFLASMFGADQDAEEPTRTPPVPDFGAGRPLTLGERKSLARKRDRELLARVIRDPHPDVIRILLDNPALTEEDVVRLSARRPIPGSILTEIFRHPRWVIRPRVRLCLTLNPHTAPGLALQLIPHLNRAERRQVAGALELPEEIRTACAQRPSDEQLH